ncbi:RNA 2'-phosphotransferase [Halorussus rarus]|uniref:RNA 2'-phosphotransferase n=1 Tax=Halorussus TaxID=1070314 RepID=UPI000E214EFA|nr:RNA 2'-phosphotransferase [Halorussus rarus]NHN60650.1 RNA 2'-phosphotransferase [Halorussus sp. JP-T4]
MTDPIYRCPDHGFVTTAEGAAPKCPECGDDVERVLAGGCRRQLSKFVSGALRHFPDDAGLELDDGGRTDYDDLVDAVARKYDWAGREQVDAVVATDPKGRFERREGRNGRDRIRAAYGHSVDVDLEDAESDVPDRLYHGTDPGNLDSILAEGLQSMNRQEVHLSATPAEARGVGRRHASEPVVLGVDAAGMVADGRRVSKRGEGTYTADEVPPAYLAVREE